MILRLLAAASAILTLCAAAAEAQTAGFTRDNNLAFVACEIDGLKQRCELDSGASQLWLPQRPEFRRYPVRRVGGVMGASGKTLPADHVRIGTLSFGGFTLHGFDALLAQGPAEHGVIGLDALQRLGAFTLDYRRDELRREPPAQADLCPLPFSLEGGLIQTPVRLAGRQSLKAAWDTGANATVADLAFIRAHPALFDFVRPLKSGTDATSTGVPVSLYRTKSLSICGVNLRNVAVVAVDMSGPKAAIPGFPDLTLGFNVLDGLAWSFDFETRRWAVR